MNNRLLLNGRQPISEEELRAFQNYQIETHSASFDQYEDAQTGTNVEITGRNVEITSRDRDMEYIYGDIQSEEDNDTNYEGSAAPEPKKIVNKIKVNKIDARKNESKAKKISVYWLRKLMVI